MPKHPRTNLPPRIDSVDPHTSRPPEAKVPAFRPPDLAPNLAVDTVAPPNTRFGLSPSSEQNSLSPIAAQISVSPVVTGSPPVHAAVNPLADYLLKPAMLRGMQPANAEGFRYIVGRTFADVENIGTVHIEFDQALKAYRMTDLYGRLPPGPVLFKNATEPTWWAQDTNPLKRPPPRPVLPPDPSPQAGDAWAALLDGPFKSLHPGKTPDELAELLRAYNLSPAQHARLFGDLRQQAGIPQWAIQHKLQSEDASNPRRFDQLRQEIEPLIPHLRNQSLGNLVDFEDSMSRSFLDGFLETLGYQRNIHNMLYRTDIPALFRGDDRTPFELARDQKMLPRMKHKAGTTTDTPISASLSFDEAITIYAGFKPPPEYLKYNYQTDTRPPRNPNKPQADSESSESESSDSSQTSGSDNSDMIRRRQRFMFTYVIDTRGMEVVLSHENAVFNSKGKNKDAWLPEDAFEAHLSVPKRDGIPSNRLWVVNSTGTRAANILDLNREAGVRGERIESDTLGGAKNKYEYDALIDRVAAAGKPILQVKRGMFADDIAWPETAESSNPV